MNRRSFLKTLASGIIIAAAPEVLVPERKFWQLDKTMVKPEVIIPRDFDQFMTALASPPITLPRDGESFETWFARMDDLYAAADGPSYEHRFSPSLKVMIPPRRIINFNEAPPGGAVVDFLNTPLLER